MAVELPFDLNPLIKSFQFYAYPLGILKSVNYHNYEYCLYHKFETIFFAENIQFYVNEFTTWEVFKWNKIGYREEELIPVLKEALKSNKYLYFTGVNEYFIPKRAATNNYKCLHDSLVIGYDKGEVIVVGYNNQDIFEISKFSCEQFKKALSIVSEIEFLEVLDKKFDFNDSIILAGLNLYFSSKMPQNEDVQKAELESRVYGVDVIGTLIHRFKNGDVRNFFHNILISVECKQLILFKLEKIKKYLNEPQIVEEYQKIKEKYEEVRFMALKKVVTNSKNFDEELIKLEKVYQKEKLFAEKWKGKIKE